MSTTEKLEEYREMREQGHISSEEHEVIRNKALRI